jgi:hypothetical protein
MQDYDKKFEIAEGNAELEKLLTEQQKKDIADINKKYADEAEKKRLEDADKLKAEEEKKAAALKQAQDIIFNLNATQEEKDMKALTEKYEAELKAAEDNEILKAALLKKYEADGAQIVKDAANDPPKLTAVVPIKLVPLIVTRLVVVAVVGKKEDIVGSVLL